MAVVIDGTNNDITGLTEPLGVGTTVGASDAMTKSAAEGLMLGVGQTWQDVKASRALGTTYTNSTGKPIQVNATLTQGVGQGATITVGGVVIGANSIATGMNYHQPSFIVPNGATYSIACAGSIMYWAELRA